MLQIRIESPPLVAFGPPEDSSGALLSGILHLYPRLQSSADLSNASFVVEKLEMTFVMEVTTKRPLKRDCPTCTTRSKVLHTWALIPSRMTLQYNNGAPHGFPFSFLIPGDLPATTQSSLAIISYKLVAEATPASSPNILSTSGPERSSTPNNFRPVILSQPIKLSRSILSNGEPKHAHRIFPPTAISAIIDLPAVIYPGATDNEVDIIFSGLNIDDSKSRWSLQKIAWQIDELAKVISPACATHLSKVGGVGGKGILYEDTRTVGTGQILSGWKYNYVSGKAEVVLLVGTTLKAMAACHVDAMSGVHVSHNLRIECVVVEERYHPSNGAVRLEMYEAIGDARVLRMSFPIIVTERGGMGISWDEEIPPRYEDVAWNAPPTFAQSEGSVVAEHRDSTED